MAGKKKYIDIVNSDWTNGIDARDLFVRLNAMVSGEIQIRIGEIGKAIEEIDKEISKMARKARRSQRAGASKEELKASEQERDNLTDMQIQLEDERDMLELFPKVKSVIDAIDAVGNDMMAKSASQSIQIEEAERELEAIEEQEREAKAKLDRAKEIDAEIKEKKKEIAALNGKRPKVMAAIQEEIDELGEEKDGLISKEEYSKIKTALIAKRSDVGKLKAEKAKTEKVLELCRNAWDGILKGYEWEDIAELSDAELSSMIGVKVERENEDKDKGDEGRGGRQGGFGGGPIGPIPPAPPAPEAEQEPEEDEEEIEDEDRKGWFTKKIEEWKANREARKEAKEAFIEEFRLTKGRKPNWWERFKAKHPKIFKEKNKLKTAAEIIEATKAARERTPEEIEAAKRLIERSSEGRIKVGQRIEELKDEEYERQAEQAKAVLRTMTAEQINRVRADYAGLVSRADIEEIYEKAVRAEIEEAQKAAKPVETADKQEGNETPNNQKENATSARKAHRSFAKSLRGASREPAQSTSKEKSGISQTQGKSSPSAPSGATGHGER